MNKVKIFLVMLAVAGLSVEAKAQNPSGTCGANLTWELDLTDSTLTISGSGDMDNFTSPNYAPWHSSYRNDIKTGVIGDSVTSIGDFAFLGCSGLNSVSIGNSVTSIGDATFFYCSSLTSVTIGNSVTSIGEQAFYGCSGLTSITIPNSVTSIGYCAFLGCSGLNSVSIGNSVTTIENYAFQLCSGLTSITCKATIPPVLESRSVFGNVPDTIPVYVPCGSVSAYQTEWSYFSNFVPIEDTTLTVSGLRVEKSDNGLLIGWFNSPNLVYEIYRNEEFLDTISSDARTVTYMDSNLIDGTT